MVSLTALIAKADYAKDGAERGFGGVEPERKASLPSCDVAIIGAGPRRARRRT
jgi:hypothetical protein